MVTARQAMVGVRQLGSRIAACLGGSGHAEWGESTYRRIKGKESLAFPTKQRLYQAAQHGIGCCLGAVGGTDLVQDVPHMGGHGSDTDDQLLGYLPVGLPRSN